MHRMMGRLSPQDAFISISSTLVSIERRLPKKDETFRRDFLDMHGRIIDQARNTLRQIEAPADKELHGILEDLTEALSRYSEIHPTQQDQDDYNDLLIGVDQMLCAGVMRHQVGKPTSSPDILARFARDRVMTLPQNSGIYSVGRDLSLHPWNVVVNETPIFGLWDEVNARGPARVIIGPKKMVLKKKK